MKMKRTGISAILILIGLLATANNGYPALSKTINLGLISIDAISMKSEEHPILPGNQATITAEVYPQDRQLKWEVEAVSPDLDFDYYPVGNTQLVIIAGEETKYGYVKVRAEDSEYGDTVNKEALLLIGCESCDNEGSCIEPGFATIKLTSINTLFKLGQGTDGLPAGQLLLQAKEMSPELSTPRALEFSTLSKGIEVLRDADGSLRQIKAPKALVNIEIIDPYHYAVVFFKPEDMLSKVDGYYEVTLGAIPYTRWDIENPDASPVQYNRLRITENKEGQSFTNEYSWDDVQGWGLSHGNGLKIETLHEAMDVAAGNRIVTRTIKNNTGQIVSVEKATYHTYPWGDVLVESVNDPNGFALTTTRTYYENPDQTGSYGKLASVTRPDGSWVNYQYDDLGRKTVKIKSWLDAAGSAGENEAHTFYYDYTPVDAADANSPQDLHRPRTVTEKAAGVTVAKTYYAYQLNAAAERVEIVERCSDAALPYGDAGNLRTTTTYYAAPVDHRERVKTVQRPDGRLETHTYASGFYDEQQDPSQNTFIPGNGSYERETIINGTEAQPDGIAFKTTRTKIIRDASDIERMNETAVYNGTAYERVAWQVNIPDDAGHIEKAYRSDGTQTDALWSCCGKESEENAEGIVYRYTYDDLKRIETVTKEGTAETSWPAQADMSTAYTYDAEGHQKTSTVSAGGLTLTSSNNFDTAGRLDDSTDTAGLTTDYTYASNGRITTVTHPDGGTEITARYLDGRTRSITWTAVVPRFYTYGVNPDGTQWTQMNIGTETSPMWKKTTTDLLGRVVKTEKPGYTGIQIATNEYNSKGQLAKTTMSGQADTLYLYDELGSQIRSGLDLDHNGLLTPASTDRINESVTAYTEIDNIWWEETIQRVYAEDTNPTATTVSTVRRQLTGLESIDKISETVTIDIHGNRTVTQVSVNRGGKLKTQTVDYPDATVNAETIHKNGLLVAQRGKTGILTTYTYDALSRPTGVNDPRTGTRSTHYNANGQVDYTADAAGHQTHYTYNSATGVKETDTNALNRTTRYKYNLRGQLTHTWGDTPYPVMYLYDDYARLLEMHTFRGDAAWDGTDWPENATGDVTTWRYHPASGLLTEKEDASGQKVTYTYQTDGKLETRTWARLNDGNPLQTTYIYDPDTGELKTIDYSDTTPDIAFTYDRLGRQKTITDALGSRTFEYNASTLQPDSEIITGLYNKTLTRTYDTVVPGRYTGFNLDQEYTTTLGYDTTGRMNSVAWTNNGNTGMVNYTFIADSDLIYQQSALNGQVTTNSYEANRNLRTQVKNESGGQVISEYDYQYDPLGRRGSVVNSGLAFTQAAFNKYGYNDRSELTNSDRYLGTNIEDLSSPVAPEKRIYNFDPIGNRSSATHGTDVKTYTPNNLNQYTQVTSSEPTVGMGYDFDGNLTSLTKNSKETKYIFNAENRLAVVEPAVPATGDKKVEAVYDYMGRRVKKTVSAYSAGAWQLEKEVLFVYDGWNVVEEITTEGATTSSKYYVWAQDLSQTLQGAGGVGGLIATIDGTNTYYHFYDGNGNVGQLVNGSNGSIAASYQYDPYGNLISSDGVYAETNTYRFSTKMYEVETGLTYYGYRYYEPELGRWLCRDPIGERGGVNVYGFVQNNPVTYWDYMGEAPQTQINDKWDARDHWRSGAGGNIPAGPDLMKDIQNSSGYKKSKEETEKDIKKQLEALGSALCKNQSGTINRAGGQIGFDAWNLAVGNISVNIAPYTVTWKNNGETFGFANISFTGNRSLSFSDDYTFNGSWTRPKSWFTDIIPSWYAGSGKPYKISGAWTDTVSGDFFTCCWFK